MPIKVALVVAAFLLLSLVLDGAIFAMIQIRKTASGVDSENVESSTNDAVATSTLPDDILQKFSAGELARIREFCKRAEAEIEYSVDGDFERVVLRDAPKALEAQDREVLMLIKSIRIYVDDFTKSDLEQLPELFPNVNELSVFGKVRFDVSLIEKFENLKELRLIASGLTPADYQIVGTFNHLVRLQVSEPNLRDVFFTQIAAFPGLIEFDCNRDGWKEHDLKSIGQSKSLRMLDLNGKGLQGGFLNKLANSTQLTELVLRNINLSEIEFERFPKLEKFEYNAPVTWNDLDSIRRCDKLTGLTFSHWLKPTADSPFPFDKFPSLTSLSVRYAELTPNSLQRLTELRQIKVLFLNDIKNISQRDIDQISQLKTLEELYMLQCKIGKEVDCSLLKGLSNMRKFSVLYSNNFDDNDLQCLAGMSKLESFECGGARISDKNLALIGKTNRLQDLKLSMCFGFTGSVFADFADGCPLEKIEIQSCDDFLGSNLNQLPKFPRLTSLEMSHLQQVNDKDILCLKKIPSLKRLAMQSVGAGPGISDRTLDQLEESLPGLEILSDINRD